MSSTPQEPLAPTPAARGRLPWLICGVVIGIAITNFWPNEPSYASSTDRNDKFALATAEISVLGATNESIWALDFLTGQLHGAVLSQNGVFTHHYIRNIAADFNINPANRSPQYAIVSGRANLVNRPGFSPATGMIYIAELTSGKIVAYAYPYQQANRPLPAPLALQPIATKQFREVVPN